MLLTVTELIKKLVALPDTVKDEIVKLEGCDCVNSAKDVIIETWADQKGYVVITCDARD